MVRHAPNDAARRGPHLNASADDELPLAAALHHDGSADVDALLAAVVDRQRRLGRRVHGLLMSYPDPQAGCAGPMVLVDIQTAEKYLVSQPMGRDSTACRGDPQGFASASGVLQRALEQRPELVVVNRFGALEAEGGGFASEFLALMAQGIPVLTAVKSRHLAAWERFTGGAPVLAADEGAVSEWLGRALPAARAAASQGPQGSQASPAAA